MERDALIVEAVWIAVGSAFLFALVTTMMTHLRIWSIAKDARRIAAALEAIAPQNYRRASNGSNEVREFLE